MKRLLSIIGALALLGLALGLAAILAHRHVNVQRHRCVERGQLAKGVHRDIDFVADAADVEQNRRWLFGQQTAMQAADHAAARRGVAVRTVARFSTSLSASANSRPPR